MSIAIYRHLKLYVAVPLRLRPAILNFHPRRLRSLEINEVGDHSQVVKVAFTHIERRFGLVSNYDETWEFHRGDFTVIMGQRRNGRQVKDKRFVVPPAYSTVWTENGITQPIYDQVEQEFASQVIIERYLHQHTPNPHAFKIVVLDFDPKKMWLGRPIYHAHLVRPLDEVEVMAPLDHSEDSHQWATLFLE